MPTTSGNQALAADAGHRTPVRPFLKWAGGKRQLLPELRRFIPERFAGYHEPFFGSGAVFFDLFERRRLEGARCPVATDNNPDLIGCYTAVRDRVDEVIAWLRTLAAAHRGNAEECYYRVREDLFNPARRRIAPGRSVEYSPELAAMFIYLNRTGFNGLFRLNSRGEFNVPVGRYANPLICDDINLRNVAAALQSTAVVLREDVFSSVLGCAQPDDLVYLDPPYAPVSSTANFTGYTSNGFSDAHQQQLRDVVLTLANRGCHVVLSNSTAPLITELYAKNDACRQAGLRAYRVDAKRAINSDATRRGKVGEYIVTNVARGA